MPKNIPHIKPKKHHNYIAFFLTFACNLNCSYCINLHGRGSRYKQTKRPFLNVDGWIRAANRLILRDDLPLTLQGGEPTIYKDFYRFINEVKKEIKMDLLTNMMFDVDKFIRNIPTWRFTREAPYAAIRVSYHAGQNDINDLIKKIFRLQDAGFCIGLYGLLHPDKEIQKHILETKDKCIKKGIDFRIKEFLGEYRGKIYGTFKYNDCVSASERKSCECRTTEIIVDPAGYVYKCHADLYLGRDPIAHILDEDFTEEKIEQFRDCHFYGECNPCDVKIKTNRYQIFGHTSVEIKNIRTLKKDRVEEAVNG